MPEARAGNRNEEEGEGGTVKQTMVVDRTTGRLMYERSHSSSEHQMTML